MTRRRVMERLERDDVLTLNVYATLAEHHASLDETVRVAGTLIGWSLHQSHDTLDAKLETLTSVARDIRHLLLKNHGARRERED
jgi:ABC-type transporter Mla subunit MlaD